MSDKMKFEKLKFRGKEYISKKKPEDKTKETKEIKHNKIPVGRLLKNCPGILSITLTENDDGTLTRSD